MVEYPSYMRLVESSNLSISTDYLTDYNIYDKIVFVIKLYARVIGLVF